MAEGTQTVFLSPLDQFLGIFNLNIFLVFKTADPVHAVERLRLGLERVNQLLPYIKGEILSTVADPEGRGRLSIRWSATDKNIELTEARVEPDGEGQTALSLVSFDELKKTGAPLRYFPNHLNPLPSWAAPDTNVNHPVLAVNYTLVKGGVVLGVGIHHGVMDLPGLGLFIRLWADCTRLHGHDIPKEAIPVMDEPLHRGRLLRLAAGLSAECENIKSDDVRLGQLLERHPELRLRPDLKTTSGPSHGPSQPLPPASAKVFAFDWSKVDSVKTAIQEHAERSGMLLEAEWLTTVNVLRTIIWICIVQVRAERRGRLDSAVSAVSFAIDGRKKMGLAEGPFLGNAFFFGRTEMVVSEFKKADLAFDGTAASGAPCPDLNCLARLVKAIAHSHQQLTLERMAEVIDLMDRAPNVRDLIPNRDMMDGPDVLIVDWGKTPLLSSDFGVGVGEPQFLRLVPGGGRDGHAMILPRNAERVGKGPERVDVLVAMRSEDMAALDRHAAWKSYLV